MPGYAVALEDALPEMLTMTERLVSIDSGSFNPAGVNAVVDEVAGALAELSFDLERRPLQDRGDQLAATLKLGRGPWILVLGHSDTVWPAGTASDWPFSLDGDRAAGPGVGDMKSCLVMAVFALRVLLDRGLRGLGGIRFLIVPDEELGSPDSRAWIEEAVRQSDVCLALEAARPGGGVVTGRGAVGSVRIEASGVSAHWADDSAGASAVSALAPLVPALEGIGADDGSRASVGIFRGGTARQVVPEHAEIHLDLRAPNDAAAGRLLTDVRRTVERASAAAGVTVGMEGGITRPAFPTAEGTLALYRILEELCCDLEAPIFAVRERGGSDASFAAALGVPTLDGLGPNCHASCSRGEWVEVPSIAERGALFAGLIATLAKGGVLPRS
jgi:glutamate carboxypeptidase